MEKKVCNGTAFRKCKNGVKEMNYLDYGMQLVVCLSEIFLFCLWTNGFVERRKMKSIWEICTVLVAALLCYGTGLVLNRLPYEIIGGIFLIIMAMVLFQGKLQTVLFYTFIYYVTETALEILLAVCIGVLMSGSSYIIAVGRYNGLLFEILVKLLQFLVVSFTIKYFGPVKEYYGSRKYLLFSLPPLSACFLLAGAYAFYSNGSGVTSAAGLSFPWILLIMGSIGAVAVNIVMVYMIEEAAKVTEENKRLELQHAQDELERKYYGEIADMHQKYDIYLHDVRRMIRIIASMVEDQQWDNASLLTDYMADSIQDIRKNTLCLHEILNALLVDRRSYAESLGLTMTIDVKEPLLLGAITEIDLVALTGNLLDNAINAEKDAAEKKGIMCLICTALDGGHIIVEIRNSYDKIKEKNKRAARKSDRKTGEIGRKHGIGLVSVGEIIRKYGGILSTLDEDNRYFVKAILPSEGKTEQSKDRR